MRTSKLGLLTMLAAIASTVPIAAQPQAIERKDFEILKADSRLKVALSGNMDNMKIEEIVHRLEEKTHVVIQLPSWLDRNQVAWPISQMHNVPAWLVMRQLAKAPFIVNGRWEKIDEGYTLVGDDPLPVSKRDVPDTPEGVPAIVVVGAWLGIGVLLGTVLWFFRRRYAKEKITS